MSTGKAERLIFDSKLKADRDYWIEKLSRELGESNLKPDFERPSGGAARHDVINIFMPRAIQEKLVKVTGDVDLLAYTLLMAALKVVLYKHTGNSSIVVGGPAILLADGEPGAANALALIDEVDSQTPFRDFLLQVQGNLKAAYERQDYPFARLVNDLGIEPVANRCSLFDLALVLKNIHTEMPEVETDATLTFVKSSGEISGEIKYRSDLFHRATIERFARHLMAVLGAALDNVDATIGELEMVTAPERHGLLVEWNDTQAGYSGERCLHRIFEAQAAQTPEAIALKSEHENLTYGELNHRANQLAHHLQAVGVGPEVIVALCMERSVEMIVGLLGILKAGGAYLPIAPSYPQERISLMLRDAAVQVLLTEERLAESLPQTGALVICLDSEWSAIADHEGEELTNTAAANNLAYVIYTSGSTGQPKGVLVDHWSASCLVDAQVKAFELTANDRVFQFASLGFDASVSEIFTTLAAGATLELGNRNALYVGQSLNQELKEREITTITLPPSVMAETLADGIPALKVVVAAGESCATGTATRWSQDRIFINAYGPTEATVCASLMKRREVVTDGASIGRAIENKRIYLLDARRGPAAIGVKGELFVGGSGLARGYLNRPDVTAEKFIPDPFGEQAGARAYATGDLACYLSDGNIQFLGRTDHQVKIRGYRIEPGEIENVLSQHRAIQDAVVIARGQGVGDKHLVAYVVPREAAEVAIGELRNYLKEFVPEYMIPAMFVTLSALPLTSSGKVDRRKLPAPEPNRPELEEGYVAPRNEIESELAQVFAKVLSIETVGIYDNFFELGGHSLLAVQLISQIRDLFQVDLDVIAAFEAPTVAELAVTVVQAQMEQLEGEGMSDILTQIEQLPESN